MLELVMQPTKRPVMLKTIAGNQRLSAKYLEQILARLREAGLVRVVRGRGGGFVLSRPPTEMTLLEILRALEGEVAVFDCVLCPDICERAEECVVRSVWCELSDQMTRYLDSVRLDQLAKDARTRMRRLGAAKARPKGTVGG
jgi:Rrf2 family protein